MADEQPSSTKQITGDDIIGEILRNAEQGIFKIRHTALIPAIYFGRRRFRPARVFHPR